MLGEEEKEGDDVDVEEEEEVLSEKENFVETKESVERGDNAAKTKLAWYLLSGYCGAKVDADKAVAMLEERVKEDDAEAMWMLGLSCEYGMGIEQDIERAETLYEQSSDKGDDTGQFFSENIGDGRGNGVLRSICL